MLSEELLVYLGIVALSTAAITGNILHLCDGFGQAVRLAFFQVSSIITTTGYATTDFNLWPSFSRTILVMLMFIGACAGSTAGGLKVSRVVILFKSAAQEVRRMLHPTPSPRSASRANRWTCAWSTVSARISPFTS